MRNLVEVRLAKPEDFLKVKETLTRIGIASRTEKKLTQSVHILHKQGRYAIVHFKELFALDGRPTNITEEDLGRRNTIVSLLAEWGLLTVVRPEQVLQPRTPLSSIKVLTHREKFDWNLVSKYTIGSRG
jgi:hypothetical protein